VNPYTIAFLLINSILLFFLPKRWAPMPLLVGACYMTLGQEVQIGPLHFTVLRILLAIGLVRVVVKSEKIAGGMNSLDWLMLIWAGWAMASSIFHNYSSQSFVNRLGVVYNTCGIFSHSHLLSVLGRSEGPMPVYGNSPDPGCRRDALRNRGDT
jgi:hypothetical protein